MGRFIWPQYVRNGCALNALVLIFEMMGRVHLTITLLIAGSLPIAAQRLDGCSTSAALNLSHDVVENGLRQFGVGPTVSELSAGLDSPAPDLRSLSALKLAETANGDTLAMLMRTWLAEQDDCTKWIMNHAVTMVVRALSFDPAQHPGGQLWVKPFLPCSGSCDNGIGLAGRSGHAVVEGPAASTSIATGNPSTWIPKLNDSPPPGPAPAGMVWIPGGQFWMGTTEDHMTDARPWHRVYVDGYWIDKTEVTDEQFARFVKATGYVTLAERKPRAEDYPQALPGNLVPGSVVFSPPDHPVELDNHFQWWNYVPGANWRHPEGPNSDIKGRMDHPVVHIAYEDAVAYCNWAGKRLPTEGEFEFASRRPRPQALCMG
jgi:formylglycine-generating enzyme required for sulfatase activity